MKKIFLVLICIMVLFSGCAQKDNTEPAEPGILKVGDVFSVTGIVEYSNEPSDIGQEYCFITGNKKIEYYYTDIYDDQSKWSSDVFYTKGDDTALLKEYVGQEVSISGVFDAESHGIPYITDIVLNN